MRNVLALCLTLFAVPAVAQDTPAPTPVPPPALLDQVEELMQKFLDRIAPQMEQMQDGLSALEPDMQDLLGRMRDIVQYYPPEVLPNGDILIRRRPPEPQSEGPLTPPAPDGPAGNGPVVTPFEL